MKKRFTEAQIVGLLRASRHRSGTDEPKRAPRRRAVNCAAEVLCCGGAVGELSEKNQPRRCGPHPPAAFKIRWSPRRMPWLGY